MGRKGSKGRRTGVGRRGVGRGGGEGLQEEEGYEVGDIFTESGISEILVKHSFLKNTVRDRRESIEPLHLLSEQKKCLLK